MGPSTRKSPASAVTLVVVRDSAEQRITVTVGARP